MTVDLWNLTALLALFTLLFTANTFSNSFASISLVLSKIIFFTPVIELTHCTYQNCDIIITFKKYTEIYLVEVIMTLALVEHLLLHFFHTSCGLLKITVVLKIGAFLQTEF